MPKEKDKASKKKKEGEKEKKISDVPSKKVPETKKKKKKSSFENDNIYLREIVQSIDKNIGMTKEAASIMNSIVKDILSRLTKEASQLCAQAKKSTVSVREMRSAVQLCFGDDLAKAALKRADAAVKQYDDSY